MAEALFFIAIMGIMIFSNFLGFKEGYEARREEEKGTRELK